MNFLRVLNAMLMLLLLLWAGWSFWLLGDVYTQLWYLTRTMGRVVNELPKGNTAASYWCLENNPEADRWDCPNLER